MPVRKLDASQWVFILSNIVLCKVIIELIAAIVYILSCDGTEINRSRLSQSQADFSEALRKKIFSTRKYNSAVNKLNSGFDKRWWMN